MGSWGVRYEYGALLVGRYKIGIALLECTVGVVGLWRIGKVLKIPLFYYW